MKISIITICYNNEDTIADTIESILIQSHRDIEYIIVDGLSSDNTLVIVNALQKDYFKVSSEKDKGIYDALNKGLSMATGDVIGILHADDLYVDKEVLELVAAQFRDTSIEGVYGDLNYVDRKDTAKIIRKWRSGNYKPNAFKWGWMPPHPAFFVRRTVYEKYGRFNTSLKSAADYELMLRFIHKFKIKLAYVPRVMVKMRVGGQSNLSIQNRLKANAEDQAAWKMNGLKSYWFTRFLKPLRKIRQYL